MAMPPFSALAPAEPDLAQVKARYAELDARFDAAADAEARAQVVADWDALRRELSTISSWVRLRFQQDTKDPGAKAARDRMDQLEPKLTELAVGFKAKLLGSAHRPELVARYGEQAFALWDYDARGFAPEIKDDLAAESKLIGEYTELLASAAIEFQGATHNLSGMTPFCEDADRDLRHRAQQAVWGFYAQHQARLDALYGELVALREGMARKLGLDSYTELAYLNMHRIDYGPDDVARFRDEVARHVVPLALELRAQQAATLGVERLRYWDEPLLDPRGNPKPQGDHDWLLARAQAMFDAVGGGLSPFFRDLAGGGYLDLETREGKAGGGFCTSFPTVGSPFVFANFNGTEGDVKVFTHEVGHAYQNFRSQGQPLLDYHWPTIEGAEVFSMGLEFLSWPHMEQFFGADAERYRRGHLRESLLFLPYGVAVDHFQHRVFAEPGASPAERNAMWLDMERRYLPWRDYGDLAYPARGAFWQRQRHIYCYPFYYVDYTLALTCALQLWVLSLDDAADALARYEALCPQGGRRPFQAMLREAGLTSPFEPGCLEEVVQRARAYLERGAG
ncbi:MAG: M3 family oligoendopeptidase [Planctomycetes bacterium]|nr:M3 family oligoendopeptidase [Planctomycetota bacterium]